MRRQSAEPTRSLSTLLTAAARRYLSVLLLGEAPTAFSIVFAAAALLLVAGSQLVAANWILVAAAAAICLAVVRVRRRWLDQYRLAQAIDRHLHLHDSLSTAWSLVNQSSRRKDAIAALQLQYADELATTVQPAQAFPFQWTRAWGLPAALLLATLALVAVRYNRSEHLDFKNPLLPQAVRALLTARQAVATELHRNQDKPHPKTGDGLQAPEPIAAAEEKQAKQGSTAQSLDATAAAPGSPQAARQAIDNLQREQQLASDRQQAGSNNLMNRIQNAMDGMMAKLREASPSNDSAAKKEAQNGQQSADNNQQAQSNEKASQSQSERGDAAQKQTGEASGQPGAAQPQAVEKRQNGGQLGNSKQPAQESGDNSQSGAGRNDGRKDLANAEQLKAIGKLEEIVGKRSAAVSGDMKVEKQSAKQQLKTGYSNDVAEHSDLGGEVNRDEIPPEYRTYIRAYMEAVRKQESTAPK